MSAPGEAASVKTGKRPRAGASLAGDAAYEDAASNLRSARVGGPNLESDGSHRASCHRCGNLRKRNVKCLACPHIYCQRCAEKMVLEYGASVFDEGCPVCAAICCCNDPRDAAHCPRLFHCYKKCPATKNAGGTGGGESINTDTERRPLMDASEAAKVVNALIEGPPPLQQPTLRHMIGSQPLPLVSSAPPSSRTPLSNPASGEGAGPAVVRGHGFVPPPRGPGEVAVARRAHLASRRIVTAENTYAATASGHSTDEPLALSPPPQGGAIPRRYGTRGVTVDFAGLEGGGGISQHLQQHGYDDEEEDRDAAGYAGGGGDSDAEAAEAASFCELLGQASSSALSRSASTGRSRAAADDQQLQKQQQQQEEDEDYRDDAAALESDLSPDAPKSHRRKTQRGGRDRGVPSPVRHGAEEVPRLWPAPSHAAAAARQQQRSQQQSASPAAPASSELQCAYGSSSRGGLNSRSGSALAVPAVVGPGSGRSGGSNPDPALLGPWDSAPPLSALGTRGGSGDGTAQDRDGGFPANCNLKQHVAMPGGGVLGPAAGTMFPSTSPEQLIPTDHAPAPGSSGSKQNKYGLPGLMPSPGKGNIPFKQDLGYASKKLLAQASAFEATMQAFPFMGSLHGEAAQRQPIPTTSPVPGTGSMHTNMFAMFSGTTPPERDFAAGTASGSGGFDSGERRPGLHPIAASAQAYAAAASTLSTGAVEPHRRAVVGDFPSQQLAAQRAVKVHDKPLLQFSSVTALDSLAGNGPPSGVPGGGGGGDVRPVSSSLGPDEFDSALFPSPFPFSSMASAMPALAGPSGTQVGVFATRTANSSASGSSIPVVAMPSGEVPRSIDSFALNDARTAASVQADRACVEGAPLDSIARPAATSLLLARLGSGSSAASPCASAGNAAAAAAAAGHVRSRLEAGLSASDVDEGASAPQPLRRRTEDASGSGGGFVVMRASGGFTPVLGSTAAAAVGFSPTNLRQRSPMAAPLAPIQRSGASGASNTPISSALLVSRAGDEHGDIAVEIPSVPAARPQQSKVDTAPSVAVVAPANFFLLSGGASGAAAASGSGSLAAEFSTAFTPADAEMLARNSSAQDRWGAAHGGLQVSRPGTVSELVPMSARGAGPLGQPPPQQQQVAAFWGQEAPVAATSLVTAAGSKQSPPMPTAGQPLAGCIGGGVSDFEGEGDCNTQVGGAPIDDVDADVACSVRSGGSVMSLAHAGGSERGSSVPLPNHHGCL